MKIQVLGSGCPTCSQLHEAVQKIVAEIGIKVEVEYLTGTDGTKRIIELGAMSSPVLVINDKIAMVGFNRDLNKLKTIITQLVKE